MTCQRWIHRPLRAANDQAHLHPALDIGHLQLAAMQLHHLLDEVQAQAGALAPAGGARQGVEAFAQACQGLVGNRFALVEQPQLELLALHLGAEADQPSGRGEIEGVVQQVGQGLA